MPDDPVQSQVDGDGFAIVEDVLSEDQVVGLIDAIASACGPDALRRRGGDVFGGRDLFTACPAVGSIARHPAVMELVASVLGPRARAVRAIYFDKTPEANWAVAWHQDRTIAVRERIAVDGYGPWSVKAGLPHVEPPVSVLERMLTIRLHLDDCPPENGALMVVPGSHRRGRITGDEATRLAEIGPIKVCPVGKGGAMMMRPLLLHASRKSVKPGHRRVLSLDYCDAHLPAGLEWHAAGSDRP